jgi:lysine 2,3-aminomutase
MSIFNKGQQSIANKIEENSNISNWKDWRWQLKHSIKSAGKFEHLTGVKFEDKERKDLEKTFKKFPLSITPYYLSLINTDNFRRDPGLRWYRRTYRSRF